jgi:hypothetical protein
MNFIQGGVNLIKDKITPELKRSFLETIEKTRNSGKEHGFFICEDKDDKLHASDRKCEGSLCSIIVDPKIGDCPGKIKGFFHAHPHITTLEKTYGIKFSQTDIKELISMSKELSKRENISLQIPSHRDVLTSLLQKCIRKTEGTVCTATDMEKDKIECWTPKRNAANFITCGYAKIDDTKTEDIGEYPKMWIKPLFDKEVIRLDE